MSDDAAAFIQFALRLYSHPGMRQVCLALQDRDGLNVNCLLLAAWAARLGYSLPPELWPELLLRAEPIRQRAIEPIRAVRRQISKDHKLSEDLRAPLKRMLLYAELRAEQAEERVLHHRMAALAQRAPAGKPLLHANLAAYAPAIPGIQRFAALVLESRLLEEQPCPSAT